MTPSVAEAVGRLTMTESSGSLYLNGWGCTNMLRYKIRESSGNYYLVEQAYCDWAYGGWNVGSDKCLLIGTTALANCTIGGTNMYYYIESNGVRVLNKAANTEILYAWLP